MRWTDVKGSKLVSTTTADTVGKVNGFLLDPASRRLVALQFKKTPQGKYARWGDLAGVGGDAVTIAETDKITDADDQLSGFVGKDHEVLKKRVLSTEGDELGKVRDIEFDPDTGTLQALVVDGNEVHASRLVGVGSWAVVVETD
ncbi:hypothetical protein D9V37_04110 [Nocardioides mangrovicus]|uniref:PRC-barrel domain-containing protein n=1 Tax=Nocardioides mangrovicus TaxID=2478913 RepID=A0A3L8P786_9ACTN|nr:PRC-barrel domain-containing protein [Nocardioides mangrovicus]RLV51111.1 hypothetical protein D9V37_04110 [Nocardioides mangrovicus]